jgi:hypothetical protein
MCVSAFISMDVDLQRASRASRTRSVLATIHRKSLDRSSNRTFVTQYRR